MTDIPPSDRKILLAITGASGSAYGQMLLRFLLGEVKCRVYLVVSSIGQQVIAHELKQNDQLGNLRRICAGELLDQEKRLLRVFQDNDFFAPIASGSSAPDTMILLPCSMGCIARICGGFAQSLIERAADVMFKQKGKLVFCPRESPLSTLHLQNLLTLSQMNAYIVPLMPAMYQKPKTIEDFLQFSIGRVCEVIGLSHQFYKPWNARMS